MSGAAEPDPSTPPPGPEHGLLDRLRVGWRLRRQATELRWANVFKGVQRAGTVTQVLLLHVRYTCGYLALGFLVSAPLQLIGSSQEWEQGRVWKSILLGLLFVLPYLGLIPFTNVDWGRMRLPEFKNLELAFCRWSVWASLGLLVLALFAEVMPGGLLDLQVAWVNLVLMFFTWVRAKSHVLMFREFYTLRTGDELVVSMPLGYDTKPPPLRSQKEPQPPQPQAPPEPQPPSQPGPQPEPPAQVPAPGG